ncbi:Hsp70 family protein [Fimbriiglobus ruber]|uniref:Chaperone protein DnaK n=1 Tax=Fimbriiglobus ruber TaxID=1908690 RepID=A0A225DU45_9BACT|nr:Hsp70 family protein [Fimbriiglobus ruber]OWK45030.1 Chaperone protein DnaK [Fimbriiglobus ruber]
MADDIIVGIDLGTTNSEVAIVEDGRPRVLNVDGDPILPSVVGIAEDGRLLVGKAARNQYVLAPDRTVKSIKRKMGEDVTVDIGDQKFRPQEISAMILRRLKDAAEQELGKPVVKAVITVPAYFNDSQRQATREAGALAGLDVVRILNEPTAAALTYTPNPTGTERFLVYDLGGGTFDVSIVQAEGGVFEVLASHGDTHLGGDDFDDLLLNHLADEFKEMYAIDLREDRVAKARLLRAAEAAKRQLSDHAFAKVEEEFIAEKDGVPLHLSTEIERPEYETLIRPLIDRTMECVQRSLDDARLTASQVARVVLVGGSTRTPLIGQLLEARLGQPAHREVHPDLCVAMGAAVQAAIVAGQNVGAVLVDISPHSLGIKCLDYPDEFTFRPNEFKFAPIIRRNTPLPASRSEIFCTVSDSQPTVEIDVYQGESEDVRRNHRVGKFLIEGLARVPAGNQLVVQLDLTLDGTLKVSAREKATGMQKQIAIENALARFAVEEREAARSRLDRLWSSDEPMTEDGDTAADAPVGAEAFAGSLDAPQLATGPAEGQRETVQARALLEKAERVREKVSAEDRTELDRLTERVRVALTDRAWGDLTVASNELTDVLFYLEDA